MFPPRATVQGTYEEIKKKKKKKTVQGTLTRTADFAHTSEPAATTIRSGGAIMAHSYYEQSENTADHSLVRNPSRQHDQVNSRIANGDSQFMDRAKPIQMRPAAVTRKTGSSTWLHASWSS